jgi:hypothetical protein
MNARLVNNANRSLAKCRTTWTLSDIYGESMKETFEKGRSIPTKENDPSDVSIFYKATDWQNAHCRVRIFSMTTVSMWGLALLDLSKVNGRFAHENLGLWTNGSPGDRHTA